MSVRIAIDGPAASGKTTTAREVARRLGYRYLDSGALYRALALKLVEGGVAVDDIDAVRDVMMDTSLGYDRDGAVLVDGVRAGGDLRRPDIADASSRVSVHNGVRDWVNEGLRAAARGGGVVMEGRDIGTVVLPDAEVKVFLVADLSVRATRRHEDLGRAGHGKSLDEVAADLSRRDERDSSRSAAPLKRADDARELDGSTMSFAEQVANVLAWVAEIDR
jgi:cytidylate kinase